MEASKIRLTVPEGIDPSRVLGAGDGVLRALESLVRAHVVARGFLLDLLKLSLH